MYKQVSFSTDEGIKSSEKELEKNSKCLTDAGIGVVSLNRVNLMDFTNCQMVDLLYDTVGKRR